MTRAQLLVLIPALLLLAVTIVIQERNHSKRRDSLIVHKAAAQGDTVLLAFALAKYPEQLDTLRCFVKDTRLSTLSPIMWAARNGQYETAKLLIDRGANINATDQFNRTALLLAVRERHVHIVDLLLEADADLDSITTSGSSPLIFAVRQGDIVMTSKLLDAGANPNIDGLGRTPLFTAVNEGHYEVVRLLVDRGAKLSGESDRTKMRSIMESLPPEKAKLIEELLSTSLK
jgi:ankyrin repeat protein